MNGDGQNAAILIFLMTIDYSYQGVIQVSNFGFVVA